MNELINKLKQICIGFPIVTKIDNHYTGASHRIYVKIPSGIVTIFWFDDKKTFEYKSKDLLSMIGGITQSVKVAENTTTS
jgi:hypothetical protein